MLIQERIKSTLMELFLIIQNNKKRKIRYLVNEILNKKEQKIKNIGTTRYSVWILK